MSEKTWRRVANYVVKAGQLPFPVNDTMVEFLKLLITDEQAEFLTVFRKRSLNMGEILKKADLSEGKVRELLESLMERGVVSGTRSRSSGVEVFTLMPPFPGLIEFQMMRGLKDDRAREVAEHVEKLFVELREGTQRNYDKFMPQVKDFPVPARVVPVEKVVKVGSDLVVPAEDINQLVDAQGTVGLTHCYCRVERDLTGHPCKVTDERENCLIFGKVAEFSIKYGFAREISREEAKDILRASEDSGLVHKVFHNRLDPNREVDGICSCCSCCCGIFRLYNEGALPFHTITAYVARVVEDGCVGCGTCEERCPMEAVRVVDGLAAVDDHRCIGCGVCVHLCPQDPKGIRLDLTGRREVFIPPGKIPRAPPSLA
ncbi:MAG: 4Fe-4S binding protein [Promethearchaeota archaeon]